MTRSTKNQNGKAKIPVEEPSTSSDTGLGHTAIAETTAAAETTHSSTNNRAGPAHEDDNNDVTGPVYFWKPEQPNGFLGQWYPSEWKHDDGERYLTAEMWMMVQKARLFGDEAIAHKMLQACTPSEHRRLGRQVRGFDEEIWKQNRFRIVLEGTRQKFSKGPEDLRTQLLRTGDRELVEAAPNDRIWGVGFGKNNAGRNRAKWGKNLLGKALMTVREELRADGD